MAIKIIDSHCHAGKGDGLTGPWDTRASLKSYVQWATESNISKTVLFSAFHSNYSLANKQVARMVQRQPNRFYGYAFVHATRDRGRIFKMVKTAVQQYGFCGIKLHRYDARISREICEAARLFRIPVLYDVVGEISVVELLGQEYPDVSFIIPHLGSFADDWRAQSGLIDYLVRFPNIYTDTSGVRRFDILQRAVDRAGAGKFLFGSDGPWLHPGVELSKIFALKLNTADTKKILSGNFLKLIGRAEAYPDTSLYPHVYSSGTSDNGSDWKDPWLLDS